MARYRLALSKLAEGDLAELYRDGIRTWGEAQADLYFDALIAHFDDLCENPLLYRAVDEIRPGYRRSICGRHVIYYRIDGQTVRVMTVVKHQSITGRLD